MRSSSSGPRRSRSSTRAVTAGSSRFCPAATRRTASTRSLVRICLSTYPAAPAMIAANSASSSANDVRIRHAVRGWRERISRQAAIPSPSCRRTSSTATSGSSAATRPTASASVLASPTTTMSPSPSSRSRRPRRTISWSSSRNTLICSAPWSELSVIATSSQVTVVPIPSAGPTGDLRPWVTGTVAGGTMITMFTSIVVALDLGNVGDRALPFTASLATLGRLPVELITISSPGMPTAVDLYELERRAKGLRAGALLLPRPPRRRQRGGDRRPHGVAARRPARHGQLGDRVRSPGTCSAA